MKLLLAAGAVIVALVAWAKVEQGWRREAERRLAQCVASVEGFQERRDVEDRVHREPNPLDRLRDGWQR